MLSVSELAEKLGMSESAIRTQARTGAIPYHRFGRCIRFDYSEVLAASRVKTDGTPASVASDDGMSFWQ